MSCEENRALVLRFVKHLSCLEFEPMFDLLAEDATWTVAGDPETFWAAGTQTKAERAATFGAFAQAFTSLEIEVISSTAEDDRVVIHSRALGLNPKGLRYENEFLILYRCRCGKIVNIHEWCDQQAVMAFQRALSSLADAE